LFLSRTPLCLKHLCLLQAPGIPLISRWSPPSDSPTLWVVFPLLSSHALPSSGVPHFLPLQRVSLFTTPSFHHTALPRRALAFGIFLPLPYHASFIGSFFTVRSLHLTYFPSYFSQLPGHSSTTVSTQAARSRHLQLKRDHLMLNFSLKSSPDYLTKVRRITTVLSTELGLHPDEIWPLSIDLLEHFLVLQCDRGNQLGTVSAYVDAAEWYHNIHKFPSLRTGPYAKTITHLQNAIGRVNLSQSTSKQGFTPSHISAIVEDCLSHADEALASQRDPTAWLRGATLFAGAGDSGSRMSELCRLTTDQVVLSSTSDTVFCYSTFESSKTAKLKPTLNRNKQAFFTIQGLAAVLFRPWWHSQSLDHTHHSVAVFPRADGVRPITYSTVRRQLLSTLSRLGLSTTDFGTHSFRRGRATTAFQQGSDLPTIRQLLQHTPTSQSTFKYLPRGAFHSQRHHRPNP
jgi:hypothetical protein